MLDAPLQRDMRSHRRSAIALARVVPAGQEGNAAFAGIVGLRLRNLPRDEGICAGGDRRFEIALGTAGAPGDPADLALRALDQGDAPAKNLLHMQGQLPGASIAATIGTLTQETE